MTDREKLVELLEKSFEEQYQKRGLLTAPHTAEHLIANGVTVQERISVKDRLPDIERDYGEHVYSAELLVTTPNGLEVAYYCHTTRQWHDARYEDEIIEVTSWMPIPEPLKEE